MRAHFLPFLLLGLVTACSPKDSPRYVHEGAREWTPARAPEDSSVEVNTLATFDLKTAAARLADPSADLTAEVLKPLSAFVLNAKFVENPAHRTTRLSEAMRIFNAAFLARLEAKDQSAAFAKLKADYIATVFSGCSRDLRRDCTTASQFTAQPHHTRTLTRLAQEHDAAIEARIKAAGSSSACVETDAECRSLLETRYRFLAMAAYNKRSNYDDNEFNFAYLKYARLFAMFIDDARNCRASETAEQCRIRLRKGGERAPEFSDMSFSYLADMNTQIFQTVIAKYTPADANSAEFKAFVENFNPWGYSKKQADLFQHGAGVMFELGTKCCLYADARSGTLSKSVQNAIEDAQAGTDHFVPTKGLSFRRLIADIKADRGDGSEYAFFRNLGLRDLVSRIETKGGSFYNEYFFIVDRLFRGHLSSTEVERVLRNTNPARARSEFPRMVTDYTKIYLAYMVVETNRFMAGIYKSNVASDRVFEEAIATSGELTTRWHAIQERIHLLDKLMGSYFKGLNTAPKEFEDASATLKAVNRNIHYISVFPNMIMMNYYLTAMNGSVKFTSWWGQQFEIDGSRILKQFFDGDITTPWFHFGVDAEPVSRLMILYSMEYLLSTEALRYFVAKDRDETPSAGEKKGVADGSDRAKFFDRLFSKYLDGSINELRTSVTKYDQNTKGNARYGLLKSLCDYENGASNRPPPAEINLFDLARYTYGGLGSYGVMPVLRELISAPRESLALLRLDIGSRRAFAAAMVAVIEQDLKRSGRYRPDHPDLAKAHELLAQLAALQARVSENFARRQRDDLFKCARTLLEVERRRTNRLYDEERRHLGAIFDEMKPLARMSEGAELDAKVSELNARIFAAPNSGYRFDRIDRRAYRMTKYDLLMRMKRRIEVDIFRSPTQREKDVYGSGLGEYLRPRPVAVTVPDGVERDEMVSAQTSQAIVLRGDSAADREDFINQGMTLLNGKSGAFIDWQSQISNEPLLFNYVATLTELFLSGPVTTSAGERVEVSADELAKSYVAAIASAGLDEFDLENMTAFGAEGRFKKDFWQGRLFDRDGQAREPFFFRFVSNLAKSAQIGLKSGGPVNDALDLAKGFNSMQAFVFDPIEITVTDPNGKEIKEQAIRHIVARQYGAKANELLQRISDMHARLLEIETTMSTDQLDPRLKLPFYLEGTVARRWYDENSKNLIDRQKIKDHKYLINDFIQQSGNFYGTREKVTAP